MVVGPLEGLVKLLDLVQCRLWLLYIMSEILGNDLYQTVRMFYHVP